MVKPYTKSKFEVHVYLDTEKPVQKFKCKTLIQAFRCIKYLDEQYNSLQVKIVRNS